MSPVPMGYGGIHTPIQAEKADFMKFTFNFHFYQKRIVILDVKITSAAFI